MFQSFRKRKEDFPRNTKTLLCLKHMGLMVMAGLKSDAWVQTLTPLMSLAGQVPSPWASACLSGKGRGGSSSAEVLKPVRDVIGAWELQQHCQWDWYTHTGIASFRAWGQHSGKSRLFSICANGIDANGLGGWGGVSPSTGQAPLYPYSPWGTDYQRGKFTSFLGTLDNVWRQGSRWHL